MIWDHTASWGSRASHELHVLLLSVAVVHLLSDPIIRLHMSPAPRAALGRCFSPRGASAFSSRLRSMVPSLYTLGKLMNNNTLEKLVAIFDFDEEEEERDRQDQ